MANSNKSRKSNLTALGHRKHKRKPGNLKGPINAIFDSRTDAAARKHLQGMFGALSDELETNINDLMKSGKEKRVTTRIMLTALSQIGGGPTKNAIVGNALQHAKTAAKRVKPDVKLE